MLGLDLRHFKEFNITPDDAIQATAVFSLVYIGVFVVGMLSFGNDKKKLAWTISLLSSSTMTVAGALYLAAQVQAFPGFFSLADNSRELFHAVDTFSGYCCLWFAIANVLDLLLGFFFYRKYLDPLTACIHHPVFIWMMWACTSGHAWFGDDAPKIEIFARAFMLMPIEELPTFLLALGSVFPACRTDLGFGLTFFLFRICYHAYVLVYSVKLKASWVPIILYVLTLTLHLFWFKSWVTKYAKKALQSKQKSL
jgi:hypothetical protein